MKFSIVVPAYNEEDAVENILRRCAAAAQNLRQANLGVDSTEIILVDDGSRDKTGDIARKIPGVHVVAHPFNRGYGAALKTGFENASGDIIGFLDADGTCDPEFFAELLRALEDRKLDMIMGSRLHPGSHMPWVRTAGNWIFRIVINLFGERKIHDAASGMRVFKRAALKRLYPLPDGLNFSPAMTVRALLDPGLSLGDIPMPYKERIGRSKLSIINDGARFLSVILDTAVTYRPFFFFGCGAAGLVVLSAAALCFPLGGPSAPLIYYLQNQRVEDWMIFRIILVTVWLSLAAFLCALGIVAQSLTAVINREIGRQRKSAWIEAAFSGRFAWLGLGSVAISIFINRCPLIAYWKTGHIPTEFWVFPVVGSLFALVGAELIAFGLVGRIARLLKEREEIYRRL